jgi:hypothetical protein
MAANVSREPAPAIVRERTVLAAFSLLLGIVVITRGRAGAGAAIITLAIALPVTAGIVLFSARSMAGRSGFRARRCSRPSSSATVS